MPDKQMIENIDFYYNKKGLMALTEKYLLERGFCCGNGCHHCPYDYENVAEPERTLLKKKKEQRS